MYISYEDNTNYFLRQLSYHPGATNIVNYLRNQKVSISITTIYKYLEALEKALIIYKVPNYDLKGKKLLQRQNKYFIVDLGIRNSAIGFKAKDISQILENIIFLELKRRFDKVYVGKEEEREIDFIAIKNDQKCYYQVTYLLSSDKTIEREYTPLLNIKDNYPKYVLSLDKIPQNNMEGIEWRNIIEFLLS